MKRLIQLLLLATTAACGSQGGPDKCPPCKCSAADCAQLAASKPATPPPTAASGATLTAAESTILAPFLDEIRAGITPWDDQSVGLCAGVGKECETFLGTSSDGLADGEYMLRANFRVPRIGEKGTWKVKLDIVCELVRTTKNGENKSTRSTSKEYTLHYVGSEHGYRLSPLRKIKSPHPRGKQTCTWSLTAMNPNGPSVIKGAWVVPPKADE